MQAKGYLLFLFSMIFFSFQASADFSDIFVKDLPGNGLIVKDSSTMEAANMPPIDSQDGLGTCHGSSATTVLQQYLCQQDQWDCSNLPDSKKISPLNMASFSEQSDKSKKVNDFEAYKEVGLSGSGAKDLINGANLVGMVYSNACQPFDQFVSKYSDNTNVTAKIFEKLHTDYDAAVTGARTSKTEGSACESCLVQEDVQHDFGKIISNKEMLEMVKKKTFEEFLYQVFFENCDQTVDIVPKPDVHIFPEDKKSNYKDTIAQIYNVLSTKQEPINLDGICVEGTPTNCKVGHSTVIAGYREICKPGNVDCHVSLKIQNSWGKSWQDEYGGGWVDAETLLNSTGYKPGTLSWLTPKGS